MRYVRPLICALIVAAIWWISITRAGDDIDSAGTLCQQTSVVLVGANGDLAKRYLWPAIFALSRRTPAGERLVFIGGTRQALSKNDLRNLVESSVSCREDDQKCLAARSKFLDQILPHQLKTGQDYRALSEQLKREAVQHSCSERGRLFYLSIPPFAFAPTAELIVRFCRLTGVWLRVVFEKPFGHDLQSAQELSSALKEHLAEHEILRVDHYLGKTAVAAMLDIRRAIEKVNGDIWNRQHIRSVDIIVKETLDVAGRTAYYNQYGVIRDMLQNHLTELLALVAMDVNDKASKLGVLHSVKPPSGKDVLLGQYRGFNDHLRQDDKNISDASHTPTFASALLWLTGNRWRGVPFRLTSGKAMDERVAYVRVLFNSRGKGKHACQEEVLFHIQGGQFSGPHIVLSEGLSERVPALPDGWQWEDGMQSMKGCPVHIAKASKTSEPYAQIVEGAVRGNMELFVGTAPLLASWHIWSHVLRSEPYMPLRLYTQALVKASYLETVIRGDHLHFAIAEEDLPSPSEFQVKQSPHQLLSVSGHFANSHAVNGELAQVLKKMADDVVALGLEAVRKHGVFHIALPGGKSPLPLFQLLAFDHTYVNFPWHYTHVWQTDERCVSDSYNSGKLSNFIQLSLALLQYVPIPLNHVHRMPVRLSAGLCSPEDKGHSAYEAELHAWNATSIDLAVLGVGVDGHVASLFPGTSSERELFVTTVCRPGIAQTVAGACRMTLTSKALSAARHVSLLIHGQGKRSIVQQIKSDVLLGKSKLPALQVAFANLNKVTWYIDNEAFL